MADVYDDWYHDVTDARACAHAVARLAGGAGRVVLELGIGTGRVALPLAAEGLDVRGIDASAAMLAVLATKPGADALAVELGDMADVPVPLRPGEPTAPPIDVVLVTYNTLFNLPDAAAQARCLTGAAAVLGPTGVVVLEVFVPGEALLGGDGSSARVRHIEGTRVVLVGEHHERATQTIDGRFVDLGPHGVRVRPFRICWQTPEQLDALAAAAGLEVVGRWDDWAALADGRSSGVDDTAPTHIAVYRRVSPRR